VPSTITASYVRPVVRAPWWQAVPLRGILRAGEPMASRAEINASSVTLPAVNAPPQHAALQ
jgi:hypothetical protein